MIHSDRTTRVIGLVDTIEATTGIEPVFPSYRPHAIGLGASWAHRTAPVDRERVRDAVRSIEWFKAGDDA